MSLSDELEKLKWLRAGGDITDEEYARAKAKLLAEESGPPPAPLAEEINPVAEEKETRQMALLLHLSCLAG